MLQCSRPLSKHSFEPIRCFVQSLGASMRRREFLGAIAGAAATWPAAAWGQQSVMPVVGYLSLPPITAHPHFLAAFRRGVGSEGFIEGQNVSIEFRSADGKVERLPELAADLIGRQVAAIFAPTSPV